MWMYSRPTIGKCKSLESAWASAADSVSATRCLPWSNARPLLICWNSNVDGPNTVAGGGIQHHIKPSNKIHPIHWDWLCSTYFIIWIQMSERIIFTKVHPMFIMINVHSLWFIDIDWEFFLLHIPHFMPLRSVSGLRWRKAGKATWGHRDRLPNKVSASPFV